MIYNEGRFESTPVDFIKGLEDLLNQAIADTEIDVTELDSYECHRHSQGYDRFAEPDDEDWDENEEFEKKVEELKDLINCDGWGEHLPVMKSEKWKYICMNSETDEHCKKVYARVQRIVMNILEKEF